jgi:integrase
MARSAPGIEVRHAKACASHHGRRCSCQPTYRAVVVLGRPGHKRRRKSQTYSTLNAAQAWRRDALLAVEHGRLRAAEPITLREASKRYLSGAADGTIRNRSGDQYKPSALRGIEQAFRLRLVPDLGARQLADVRRADLQQLVNRMQTENASPSTIRNTINAARALYRHAMQHDLVSTDPTDGLALPAVRGRRDRVAGPAEARALLAAVPDEDRPIWATAMHAGLRLGELQALGLEHIDIASGYIHVERSWDRKAGFVAPKSLPAGRRAVPITAALRPVLVEHRERLLALGRTHGFAFGRSADRPFNPTTITGRAERGWEAAKLTPIGLHECRHTCASTMMAAGVPIKAVSTYMGHSSIAITSDRYGHLLSDAGIAATSLIDAFLARQQATEALPDAA